METEPFNSVAEAECQVNEVDLIDLIYCAALSDNWRAIMEALRAATGDLVSPHIYGHDMAGNRVAPAASSSYDPDMMAIYDQHYHTLNVWVPGIATASMGSVLPLRDYRTDDDLLASEFYNDWVKPHEDRREGGGLVVFDDDRRFVPFGGKIRFKDREQRAERPWFALLEHVSPHIRNAFEIRRRLRGERLVSRGYLDLIDRLEDSIFLIAADGGIQFRNKAASELGADRKLFFMDHAGAMRLLDAAADDLMRAGLAAIRRRDYDALDGTFLIRRAETRPLTAILAPFAPDQDATGHPSDFVSDHLPVAVLTIHDRMQGQSPQTLLKMAYGLTSAEADLALALRGGASLKEHAGLRRVSLHTVRNQLKSIFDKTGIHRQAELVALLSRTLD